MLRKRAACRRQRLRQREIQIIVRAQLGHSGIYSAQRIGLSKYSAVYLEEGVTLANYRQPKIGLLDDSKGGGSNSQE